MIGVIDTGVDITHKRFAKTDFKGITFFSDNLGKIILKKEFNDNKGHGTGIASIIESHVPSAEMFIVKLDSYNGIISENLLYSAISFLIKETDVKIINISMGIKTNSPSPQLKEVCDDAVKKGVAIVAASYYLHNELCYPAHFNSVIAVGQGIVKSKYEFRYSDNNVTNVLAKGGFQRVAIPGNQFAFSAGTSLSTAHFTGIIAKSLINKEWESPASLKQWLSTNSDNSIISLTKHDQGTLGLNTIIKTENKISRREIYSKLRPSLKINKIAIFPFEEKEMNSVVEFNDLLSHTLTLAIGLPRILKFDKAVDLIIEKNLRYTIKQLVEEEYALFDTIVIGYFLDKLSDHNSYFGYNLIRECILRNKNFIVWDKAVYDLTQAIKNDIGVAYTGEIYLTCFDAEKKEMLYSGMDYAQITTPSICVIGTNSRQGKFTTQLIVKKILQEYGYRVSHLSTEPQGILLGADVVFPIGHNGTIYIDVREWNKTLQFLIQLMETTNKPDVIITGSQGGILPLHPINDSAPPEKLIYTKAFHPDALICTISPNDSLEFILRTTDVVKSFVKTEVIFYVLTPWQYQFHHGEKSLLTFKKISEHEYAEKLSFFNEHLKRPVINIKDNKNHPEILDLIQQFFSNK
jgi:hypothetical protein